VDINNGVDANSCERGADGSAHEQRRGLGGDSPPGPYG
jgi:hypothetical protein